MQLAGGVLATCSGSYMHTDCSIRWGGRTSGWVGVEGTMVGLAARACSAPLLATVHPWGPAAVATLSVSTCAAPAGCGMLLAAAVWSTSRGTQGPSGACMYVAAGARGVAAAGVARLCSRFTMLHMCVSTCPPGCSKAVWAAHTPAPLLVCSGTAGVWPAAMTRVACAFGTRSLTGKRRHGWRL